MKIDVPGREGLSAETMQRIHQREIEDLQKSLKLLQHSVENLRTMLDQLHSDFRYKILYLVHKKNDLGLQIGKELEEEARKQRLIINQKD